MSTESVERGDRSRDAEILAVLEKIDRGEMSLTDCGSARTRAGVPDFERLRDRGEQPRWRLEQRRPVAGARRVGVDRGE